MSIWFSIRVVLASENELGGVLSASNPIEIVENWNDFFLNALNSQSDNSKIPPMSDSDACPTLQILSFAFWYT